MSNKYCPPLSRVTIWDGVFDTEKSILKKWANLTSHQDLLNAINELDDKSKYRVKHSLKTLTANLRLEVLKQKRIYEHLKLYLSLGRQESLVQNFRNGGQNIKYCLRQLLTYFFSTPFKHLRGFKLKSDRNEIKCYRNLYEIANKSAIEIQNEMHGQKCTQIGLEIMAVHKETCEKFSSAIEACDFALNAFSVTTITA